MRYKPFTFLSSTEGLQGCISASGGQEIIIGNFKYHIFTGSFDVFTTSSFIVHSNPCSDLITVLSVARGGNGGGTSNANRFGGGGAGGVETSSFSPVTGSYTMALFASGAFGNGDSIAFSGSAYTLAAQRGGNGATNTVSASNGGGGSATFPTGALNVYGYSGSNYGQGAGNDQGAGAGVGGDGTPRSGDSSLGGIGIFIPEFAPLDGQFTSGSNPIYYGGYPAGFYGGGGGGQTNSQLGEGTQGGGGRNHFPNPFGFPSIALNGAGVDFVGGGGMGGNFFGNVRGGRGAIYIRYPA